MWLNKVQISDRNTSCYSALLTIKVYSNKQQTCFLIILKSTEQKTEEWRVKCFAAVVS